MNQSVFLEPLDVLFLRGNKLFGDPGSYGEALIPPWPSVAAGALRSRMLVDDGIDLAAFARGEINHPTLGTPAKPGTFAVTAFHLARRGPDGNVECLIQPPADLVLSEADDGTLGVRALNPNALSNSGLCSSFPLPQLPVLAEPARRKPVSGYWLGEAGWRKYLVGAVPDAADFVKTSALWQLDRRVGVGLDGATGRANDGQLFSMQAVAMRRDVGFLATVTGAVPAASGSLRFGGDGRAAAVSMVAQTFPAADYAAIADAGRCRLLLTTPGLFENGWLPTGINQHADGSYRFELHGVKARLVSAAVPRAEVVSGWDLANWQPKPAQRAVPSGSVYWFDEINATADALGKLVEAGLWCVPCEDAARRAEGFNRCHLAAWKIQ
ncbi:MAG: type III-B CRISPR module-associated Cmr3 family protein [Xanthomonadaceae bacterium]|nr:type III-B CRISPR module-associated Cmr3 family protein [Xanthomonadaceae bacterium]MDP2185410.1 type III-B CRISPR module-associated Cmr3 family protein [Xanthomonadales bacterium]MDZ4116824.1 type III-B CRISPR module-associated Cmr3 family protein [Xanthomonadaceae bacterium]MDZ4379209.1 type III-B CRISPR module-associated Cmr3 family protein [Xanthomonadaceae bacterium]